MAGARQRARRCSSRTSYRTRTPVCIRRRRRQSWVVNGFCSWDDGAAVQAAARGARRRSATRGSTRRCCGSTRRASDRTVAGGEAGRGPSSSRAAAPCRAPARPASRWYAASAREAASASHPPASLPQVRRRLCIPLGAEKERIRVMELGGVDVRVAERERRQVLPEGGPGAAAGGGRERLRCSGAVQRADPLDARATRARPTSSAPLAVVRAVGGARAARARELKEQHSLTRCAGDEGRTPAGDRRAAGAGAGHPGRALAAARGRPLGVNASAPFERANRAITLVRVTVRPG